MKDPVTLLRGLSAVIYFQSGNSNTVFLLSLPAHRAGTQAGSLKGRGCRAWGEEYPELWTGHSGAEAVDRMDFIVTVPVLLEAPHLHANNV